MKNGGKRMKNTKRESKLLFIDMVVLLASILLSVCFSFEAKTYAVQKQSIYENNSQTQEEMQATQGLNTLQLTALLEDGTESEIALSPEFANNIYEYTCTVPETTKSLDVLAYAVDINAIVDVQGAEELKDGENVVTILVTEPDGTQGAYTIKVTKEAKEVPSIPQNVNNLVEKTVSAVQIAISIIIAVTILIIILLLVYYYQSNGNKKTKDPFEDLPEDNIARPEPDPSKKKGKHF